MRLTTYTDYALRVLIQLASGQRDLTTIAEVADVYSISDTHLTKLLHQPGVVGYIATVRGRNGAACSKKPGDINIGEVTRVMEPDSDLAPCSNTSDFCVIKLLCVLKEALGEARDAFLACLAYYTLVDLVASKRELNALIAIRQTSSLNQSPIQT